MSIDDQGTVVLSSGHRVPHSLVLAGSAEKEERAPWVYYRRDVKDRVLKYTSGNILEGDCSAFYN